MGAADQTGFHYTRYVVAVLGMIAAALLSMSEMVLWRAGGGPLGAAESFKNLTGAIIFVTHFIVVILLGIFIRKFSAKWTVTIIVVLHSLLSLSHSMLEVNRLTIPLLVLSNAVLILTLVAAMVALHAIIANWSPPTERTLMTSLVWSGTGVGLGATFGLSYFDERSIPSIVFGVVAAVWLVLWTAVISDSPHRKKHFISNYEKNYIENAKDSYWAQPSDGENLSMGRILISREFLVLTLVQCATLFAKAVFHHLMFKGQQILYFQGIIFGDSFPVGILWGAFMTVLLQKKKVSFDVARKISGIISNLLILMAIIAECVIESSIGMVVYGPLLHAANSMFASGTIVNLIDISPKFAPLLVAIHSLLICQGFVLLQPLLELISQNFGPNVSGVIFITSSSAIVLVSSVVYVFWGSTEQKTMNPKKLDRRQGTVHMTELPEIQSTLPVDRSGYLDQKRYLTELLQNKSVASIEDHDDAQFEIELTPPVERIYPTNLYDVEPSAPVERIYPTNLYDIEPSAPVEGIYPSNLFDIQPSAPVVI